jgi:hypothetical protein
MKFINPTNWFWAFDLIVSLASLFALLFFSNLASTNSQSLNTWASILAIFPFIYSSFNLTSKWSKNKREKIQFREATRLLFDDCRRITGKHLPTLISDISIVEEKVIGSHFTEWKKYGNIQSFELTLISTWLNLFSDHNAISLEDKEFIKYVIITGAFPQHFSTMVSEIENGNFFENNSPHNLFIRKLHQFIFQEIPLDKIELPEISNDQIEETINIAFNQKSSFIKQLLDEKSKRQKIEYLLKKSFENAYTNANKLNINFQDESKRKLIFLYKYDERFSILKRVLREEIRKFETNSNNESEVAAENISSSFLKLDEIMYPLPLSKALTSYRNCIERITPRDPFSFIISPSKFPEKAFGWTSEKFMNDIVLQEATKNLAEFNRELVKHFPYLRKHRKKYLDANYYLFSFDNKSFSVHASEDAIPIAFKRFIVQEILDTENAGEVVASQLVYLKQIINNLSLSGLLFTEELDVQEKVRSFETKIVKEAAKANLAIESIYEFASLGNQFGDFVRLLHTNLHQSQLIRKVGKKYEYSLHVSTVIKENASEIIELFNSIESNSNEQ